jgi:hypothetical protein
VVVVVKREYIVDSDELGTYQTPISPTVYPIFRISTFTEQARWLQELEVVLSSFPDVGSRKEALQPDVPFLGVSLADLLQWSAEICWAKSANGIGIDGAAGG